MDLRKKIAEWKKVISDRKILGKIEILERAIAEGKKIFVNNLAISGFDREFLLLKCPKLSHWKDADYFYEDYEGYYAAIELDQTYLVKVSDKC